MTPLILSLAIFAHIIASSIFSEDKNKSAPLIWRFYIDSIQLIALFGVIWFWVHLSDMIFGWS